jgi:hypothetical protein
MTDEGSLSLRQGGEDGRIYRCECGAWRYTGIACVTCATTRGEEDGSDSRLQGL